MPDNVIVIEGLDLGYDGEVLVPDFLNLAVETDEFVSLLGLFGLRQDHCLARHRRIPAGDGGTDPTGRPRHHDVPPLSAAM